MSALESHGFGPEFAQVLGPSAGLRPEGSHELRPPEEESWGCPCLRLRDNQEVARRQMSPFHGLGPWPHPWNFPGVLHPAAQRATHPSTRKGWSRLHQGARFASAVLSC